MVFEFRMRSPVSGKEGIIPKEKLRNALRDGYTLVDDTQSFKMLSPWSGKEGYIPAAKLKNALRDGYTIVDPNMKDTASQFIKGAAHGVGALADTAVAAGAKLAGTIAGPIKQYLPNPKAFDEVASDYWNNDKIAKTISQPFETNTNYARSTRWAEAAGEATASIVPFNLAGKAITKGVTLLTKGGSVASKVPWVEQLNKLIGSVGKFAEAHSPAINTRNIASFAGAGAGGAMAKSYITGDQPNAPWYKEIAARVRWRSFWWTYCR